MRSTPQRSEHHPEGDVWTHTALVMDYAARTYNDPEITFSAFTHDFGKPVCYLERGTAHAHEKEGLPVIEEFCKRWKVPNNYRDLALLVCEHHNRIHGVLGRSDQKMTKPKNIMNMFQSTAALTKPERFEKILKCCIADARGRGAGEEQIKEFESKPYPQADYLRECLQAVIELNTKSISKELLAKCVKGASIGEHIRVARIDAIRGVYNKWKELK